jgi:2-polyprenyl-3-methyl-5-hydroxy-6-metoxy-1,4-benzoquinol methylase
MPVNYFHGLLHPVEKGWDPVSAEYAQGYAQFASTEVDAGLVDRLGALSGGLAGKRVLDLGGGPGQWSVLFAKLGAHVVWHDPSRTYQKLASAHAEANGVSLEFSLGYLEEAKKFGQHSFDLVFCRVCWYYSRDDRAFSRLLCSLVKPGGVGYVECNIPDRPKQPTGRRIQSWLNDRLWLKIGHPLPPRGRIAALIHRHPVRFLEADYRSEERDIVIFQL